MLISLLLNLCIFKNLEFTLENIKKNEFVYLVEIPFDLFVITKKTRVQRDLKNILYVHGYFTDYTTVTNRCKILEFKVFMGHYYLDI